MQLTSTMCLRMISRSRPTAESKPATPVWVVTTPERTATPKAWASQSCLRAQNRLHSCRRTCCPIGLPRGAAELCQLQDHNHQNDNDQDPDDDPNNSSVHFASSIRVLTRNFRSGS
jgi:hypothetical protein